MKIIEIGTGYTPIPAQVAAATESVVEELTKSYIKMNQPVGILDISAQKRAEHNLPITEVMVPSFFTPVLMRIWTGERQTVAANSSSRR